MDVSPLLNPDQPVLGQKYRLIRQLEVGGMGSVWLAEHVHLGSLVAVKLMAREVAATAIGTERFLREARTAASLRSPNVVQILDYGVHDGTPFIAMEWLEGESLAARIDREGRFQSWERAERVLRYVARAVGRAHDAGIIHRDLKPANIFLVRDEEEEVVKLLDFGIAKTTRTPFGVLGTETRTGEFLGSPTYASPEQLQVSKTLDQRADIWSFGVIAYECLLGNPPFVAQTLVGLVLDICSNPLPIPSQRGPVPAGFDAWFARVCARDLEQRFADVREASAELCRLVAAACGERSLLSEVPPPASRPAPSPAAPPTSSAWPPPPASLSEAPLPPASLPEAPLPSAALSLPPWVLLPELSAAPPSVRTSPTVRQPGRAALLRARFGTPRGLPSELNPAGPGASLVERRWRLELPALLVAGLTLLVVPLLLFALRAPASRAVLDTDAEAKLEASVDEQVLALGAATGSESSPSGFTAPSAVPSPTLATANDGSAVIAAPSPAVAAPSAVSRPADAAPADAVPASTDAVPAPAEPALREVRTRSAAHSAVAAPSPAVAAPATRSAAPSATAVSELSPSASVPSNDLPPAPSSATRPPAAAPSASPPSVKAPSARAVSPRRQSRLTLTASSPSHVFLDGRAIGTTPLADLAVQPGVHEITFSSDGERSSQRVELRAGEHKRVHASPAASSQGDGLDEAAVQRTLRGYGPSVRDICWERALRGRPPTAGPTSVRVSARISVAPSGRVRSVSTSGAPAEYPDLPRCIEEKVRAWSFPRALGETVVNVPFVFVEE